MITYSQLTGDAFQTLTTSTNFGTKQLKKRANEILKPGYIKCKVNPLSKHPFGFGDCKYIKDDDTLGFPSERYSVPTINIFHITLSSDKNITRKEAEPEPGTTTSTIAEQPNHRIAKRQAVTLFEPEPAYTSITKNPSVSSKNIVFHNPSEEYYTRNRNMEKYDVDESIEPRVVYAKPITGRQHASSSSRQSSFGRQSNNYKKMEPINIVNDPMIYGSQTDDLSSYGSASNKHEHLTEANHGDIEYNHPEYYVTNSHSREKASKSIENGITKRRSDKVRYNKQKKTHAPVKSEEEDYIYDNSNIYIDNNKHQNLHTSHKNTKEQKNTKEHKNSKETAAMHSDMVNVFLTKQNDWQIKLMDEMQSALSGCCEHCKTKTIEMLGDRLKTIQSEIAAELAQKYVQMTGTLNTPFEQAKYSPKIAHSPVSHAPVTKKKDDVVELMLNDNLYDNFKKIVFKISNTKRSVGSDKNSNSLQDKVKDEEYISDKNTTDDKDDAELELTSTAKSITDVSSLEADASEILSVEKSIENAAQLQNN